MQPVNVYKNRTTVVSVSLGFDVSNDTITGDIRVSKNSESDIIASWEVTFLNDGSDGELILTLDDSVVSEITESVGYMDLKRVSGGEPYPVFDSPLDVLIVDTITE